MCYTEIGKLVNHSEYSLFAGGKTEKKLWDLTKLAEDKNFKRIRLEKSSDIWKSFKKTIWRQKIMSDWSMEELTEWDKKICTLGESL
jgi:hypothetical protein